MPWSCCNIAVAGLRSFWELKRVTKARTHSRNPENNDNDSRALIERRMKNLLATYPFPISLSALISRFLEIFGAIFKPSAAGESPVEPIPIF